MTPDYAKHFYSASGYVAVKYLVVNDESADKFPSRLGFYASFSFLNLVFSARKE